MTAECPECARVIDLDAKLVRGEIVICPECGADLELVSLELPRLALAPKEQEDWGE